MLRNCGRCHTCGARTQTVLDGEEWCPECQQYRRYKSHGWAVAGRLECPAPAVLDMRAARLQDLHRDVCACEDPDCPTLAAIRGLLDECYPPDGLTFSELIATLTQDD